MQDKIFTIRNQQVMLDRDLAELYEVKTIRLREQLKRNIARFPQDFSFQLNEKETENMVSQNAIPSKKHLGGSLPHVFTEQGIAMLASVLNSKKAIDVNIKIMRAFVSIRKTMIQNASVFQKFQQIDQKFIEQDSQFDKIFEALEQDALPIKQGVLFEGEFFTAHKLASDIISQAKESIILIDNYVNEDTLTLFTECKVPIIIYSKDISKKLDLASKKFNEQYGKLELQEFTKSHDRFLIIDNQIYHIGASLKDLGKKWFAFTKLDLPKNVILDKLK